MIDIYTQNLTPALRQRNTTLQTSTHLINSKQYPSRSFFLAWRIYYNKISCLQYINLSHLQFVSVSSPQSEQVKGLKKYLILSVFSPSMLPICSLQFWTNCFWNWFIDILQLSNWLWTSKNTFNFVLKNIKMYQKTTECLLHLLPFRII